MRIERGNEREEYEVEIWQKKGEVQGVYLENRKKDESEAILRNGNGVFVVRR